MKTTLVRTLRWLLLSAWAAAERLVVRRVVRCSIVTLERKRLASARWAWWGDWAISVLQNVPPAYDYAVSLRPKKCPSLYAIGTEAWEERYLSAQYRAAQDVEDPRARIEALGIEERTGDLFVFPVFSPAFCDDLVCELDGSGCWTGGDKNTVDRNRSGWAPVDKAAAAGGLQSEAPARDLSLHKIMFDRVWARLHARYVRPVIRSQYNGYLTKGSRGIPFALRYYAAPTGTPGQTPHHDDSVVTVNLSLCDPDEYEGGGCVFFRQRYVLAGMRKGEVAVHPGALTHFHAGVAVTRGVRTCLVSFYR